MEILTDIHQIIQNILIDLGILGPVFACIFILIESMLPVLPLAVFITLNFIFFGKVLGFLISVIFTIIGCYISFMICRKGLSKWFSEKIAKRKEVSNLMIKFSNISFGALTILIAMPFTPAFIVNIAAGFSTMSKKKFLSALIIGKVFIVYFWGYVGVSLVNSLKDPIILLRIAFLMLLSYIISKGINKILKID